MEFSFVNHQIGIIVFLFACLVILTTNFLVLHQLGSKTTEILADPETLPIISILVPARNEEASIRDCVNSLLEQDYPNFEIIVLNDHSTDNTAKILTELALASNKLRIVDGKDLPPGWLGKNWACHQLAEISRGTFLLFTDADTHHEPTSVRNAFLTMTSQDYDFISALPYQIVKTFGEKLLVPALYWYTQSFISLVLSYLFPLPMLSTSIGQFMFIRRDIYQEIGGYAAIRDQTTDDLALVRLIKAHKHKWRLFDGTSLVQCRMYRNFSQVISGFTKNFFAAFGNKIIPYLFVWIWIAVVFLEPPLILLLKIINAPIASSSVWLALIASFGAFLLWGLTLIRFRFPFWVVFFYPIIIILSEVVAFKSLLSILRGSASWKDRTITKPGINWF